MKITRLELENWMGIPQLALELGSGINLLYGRNEIGKSSIIESIRQALLGDANSSRIEYKRLKPWGVNAKATVKLSFTTGENTPYRICKTFPQGSSELYQANVLLSNETKKTQEKLYKILEISEKTTNLFRLLFIDQGDALNIFDKKENPLDENTKSYIKEIIKETAFKEIQEIQNYIQTDIDRYLTGTRKSPKKGTEYYSLLEKEQLLAEELEKLEQKESEINGKLNLIETNGKEILRLTGEIENKEKYLDCLKQKKIRLEELNQKEITFQLVQKDYDNYLKITGEQEEIKHRLPVLAATREHRLKQLKKDMLQQEAKKTESITQLEQLKQKRQEWEKLDAQKKDFGELKKEYDEICNLLKQSSELQEQLPSLFLQHRTHLNQQLQEIMKTIRTYTQLESQKKDLEKILKEIPSITAEDIATLKKLEKNNENLNTRIESAKEKLQLSFHMTPLEGKEIPYEYETDGKEPVQGKTAEPLEINDFHCLQFTYHHHMELCIKGNLTETDIDSLQVKVKQNQLQIHEKLAVFGVGEIHALEQKYNQRNELETRLKSIHDQLLTLGETDKLTNQEKAIREQLEKLDQDEQTYLKVNSIQQSQSKSTGQLKTDTKVKETKQGTAPEIRDRLTAAKTRLDSYRQEITNILSTMQCNFDQLEVQYKQQETELQQRELQYREMEPKAIDKIDQSRIDEEVAKRTGIETKIYAIHEELKLLESMASVHSQTVDAVQGVMPLTGLSTQMIRDEIIQSSKSAGDLEKRKKELLGNAIDQEFRMNYFRRNDEIDLLKKAMASIPPESSNDLTKVNTEIDQTGNEIKNILQSKGEIEKHQERLKGETTDFSGVIGEKTQKEEDYREVLAGIRSGVVELSSLKLLNHLIEEERNKAQQEVFKPLQERVHRSFTSLVGERYRVGIDNDLNLNISGRTGTGEFQTGVGDELSFGTKEQLSFLFRLAIAAQLSRKEPAVMVLDDSFVNTDMNRLPMLLDMLMKREEEMQFLVFTCRPEDYLSYLVDSEEKYIHMHRIDLEKIMNIG